MREFVFTMSLSLLQQLVDNRGLRWRIPTRLEIKKGKVQWLSLNLKFAGERAFQNLQIPI